MKAACITPGPACSAAEGAQWQQARKGHFCGAHLGQRRALPLVQQLLPLAGLHVSLLFKHCACCRRSRRMLPQQHLERPLLAASRADPAMAW